MCLNVDDVVFMNDVKHVLTELLWASQTSELATEYCYEYIEYRIMWKNTTSVSLELILLYTHSIYPPRLTITNSLACSVSAKKHKLLLTINQTDLSSIATVSALNHNGLHEAGCC